MPRGAPISKAQRLEIMNLYNLDRYTQLEIANMLNIGESTTSRIINQELGILPMPKNRKIHKKPGRNISVAAIATDHAMITAYAKEHKVPMHEALHALLHNKADIDLVDTIKREVEVIMKAAKTEVEVIKKKWWHL